MDAANIYKHERTKAAVDLCVRRDELKAKIVTLAELFTNHALSKGYNPKDFTLMYRAMDMLFKMRDAADEIDELINAFVPPQPETLH